MIRAWALILEGIHYFHESSGHPIHQKTYPAVSVPTPAVSNLVDEVSLRHFAEFRLLEPRFHTPNLAFVRMPAHDHLVLFFFLQPHVVRVWWHSKVVGISLPEAFGEVCPGAISPILLEPASEVNVTTNPPAGHIGWE